MSSPSTPQEDQLGADISEFPPSSDEREYDVYKDSLLRFAGYANELGEAFKVFIPRSIYFGTYGIAAAYALGDTVSKGHGVYTKTGDVQKGLQQGLETGLWQVLASVVIPPFFVNRMVNFGYMLGQRYLMRQHPTAVHTPANFPGPLKWFPTALGLACIPFIVYPIDRGVDYFIHYAYKPFSLMVFSNRDTVLEDRKQKLEEYRKQLLIQRNTKKDE